MITKHGAGYMYVKRWLLGNWKSQVQNYVPKGACYCDRKYLQIYTRVLTHHVSVTGTLHTYMCVCHTYS